MDKTTNIIIEGYSTKEAKKLKKAGFKEIKLVSVGKVMKEGKFSFIDNFKEDFIFFFPYAKIIRY